MDDVVLISSESSNDENMSSSWEPLEKPIHPISSTTSSTTGCFESLTTFPTTSTNTGESIASLRNSNKQGPHSISSDSDSASDDNSADFKQNRKITDSCTSVFDTAIGHFQSISKNGSLASFSVKTGGGLCSVGSSSSTQESYRFTQTLSDSEDDIEDYQHRDYKNSVDNVILNSHFTQFSSQVIDITQSNSNHADADVYVSSISSKEENNSKKICGKRKSSETDSKLSKKELTEKRRKEAKEEKERKKTEQANAKALKQAALKIQKVYKLEECLNYITALLDRNLFEENLGGDLKLSLQGLEVQYQMHSQIYPMTITWNRKIPVDDGTTKINVESHALLVLTSDRVIDLVLKSGLHAEVQAAQTHFTDMKLSLILHGTEQYFRPQKKGKTKNVSHITREDLTEALVEVQILSGCNHRFAESSMELAMLIAQFSKAVAEIPYRLEKAKKEENKLDWFGEGDNRDCARVDKNGVGLQRLWRQQLCEFNLAGLQISEAITAVYQNPQALFQAYDACNSQNDAEKLLQDIPIRRNVGALSSARRIGPELSKKIHAFFTSLDGTGDVSLVHE